MTFIPPPECDSPGICGISRRCAGRYVTQAICASKPTTTVLPDFDSLPDDAIDDACAAGGIYRVDFMRAWNALRLSLDGK